MLGGGSGLGRALDSAWWLEIQHHRSMWWSLFDQISTREVDKRLSAWEEKGEAAFGLEVPHVDLASLAR